MSDPEFAANMLRRLRAIGVQIGIDDFGTGYSSLSYLRRFPIDTLKIDRSFVQRIQADTRDWEIIQTIVRLAHNLAMDVVAEGVETHEQRHQLQSLGCELGQGFYFSQAVAGPTSKRCSPPVNLTTEEETGERQERRHRVPRPEHGHGNRASLLARHGTHLALTRLSVATHEEFQVRDSR